MSWSHANSGSNSSGVGTVTSLATTCGTRTITVHISVATSLVAVAIEEYTEPNGNTAFIGVVNIYNQGSVSSITDNLSNTYHIVDQITDGAGAQTTTFGWDDNQQWVTLLDGHAAQSLASQTPIFSNSTTTTKNGDLIVGLAGTDGNFTGWTAGGSFALKTSVEPAGGVFCYTEDQTQGTAGSIFATFSNSNGDAGVVGVIALAVPVGSSFIPRRKKKLLKNRKVPKIPRKRKIAATPAVLPAPRPRHKPKRIILANKVIRRRRKSAPWFATPTQQPVPAPRRLKHYKPVFKHPIIRKHKVGGITAAAPAQNTAYTPKPRRRRVIHHQLPVRRKHRISDYLAAAPVATPFIPRKKRKRLQVHHNPVKRSRRLEAGFLSPSLVPWQTAPKKRHAPKQRIKRWHHSKVAGILARILPPQPTPVSGTPAAPTYEEQRNVLFSAFNTNQLTARQYYYALYALQWKYSGAISWQASFRPKLFPGDLPLSPIQPFRPNQFIGGSADRVVDAATLVRTAQALITQGVPYRLFPAPPPPRWAFMLYGNR